MAIPLKEGLQIRCAFCGTAAEGRQFVEKAKSLGQIRELNEVDQQRQKQARVEGWFASLTEEGVVMC
jgi:radical SAM superfamily enzyme